MNFLDYVSKSLEVSANEQKKREALQKSLNAIDVALKSYRKDLEDLGLAPEIPQKESESEEESELLTAEILGELSCFTSSQLERIYHHGERKVRIDQDPKAYAELRGFTTSQIEAIFGERISRT